MAKFYVIHYTANGRLPKLTPEGGEALKSLLGQLLAQNPAVKYNGTMFDPGTGIGVCDWEGPDLKAVEDVVKALGVPNDAVVPVEPLTL